MAGNYPVKDGVKMKHKRNDVANA